MKFILELRQLSLLICSLIFWHVNILAQSESNKTTDSIFTTNLVPVSFDSLINTNQILIVINRFACQGCVEYLIKNKIGTNFLFVIEDKSRIEMIRVISTYNLKDCNIFYAPRTDYYQSFQMDARSPILIYSKGNLKTILDYDQLYTISNGFTLKKGEMKKRIKDMM